MSKHDFHRVIGDLLVPDAIAPKDFPKPDTIEPEPRTHVRGIFPFMLRMSDSVGTYSIPGFTSGDLRRYFKILKDPTCDDPGKCQTIPLYSTSSGKPIELCNVDMLIEVGGKAKVIIEIEESDVTPVHLFGKFFVTAFSDTYRAKKNERRKFIYPLLFVQVLESSERKPGSGKTEQWERIQAMIHSFLANPFLQPRWEYRLFYGLAGDFGVENSEGEKLRSAIRDFLERNQ